MAKAIVDPNELRRFAGDLKKFNNDVQTQMTRVGASLGGLQQTWRDQEQVKFSEEFEQTMGLFKNLSKPATRIFRSLSVRRSA